MGNEELRIEFVGESHQAYTPEGMVYFSDFRTNTNEFIGRIVAYPNLMPPLAVVIFINSRIPEDFHEVFLHPTHAQMRLADLWLGKEVILDAIQHSRTQTKHQRVTRTRQLPILT